VKVKIISYGIKWNPKTKHGEVIIRLENGNTTNVPISSAEEFSAVALVLSRSPVFVNMNTGDIETEWEPV
jgi:hypothetical protein